ncbi:MAG: hypothetical protein Q9166_004200 [cf. Caloplaca sp. 2 TL-2023]
MASLLLAGGVLAYEKIKESKAKKVAKKAHNAARYSDLQASTCTCPSTGSSEKQKTWGCPVHDPAHVGMQGGITGDGRGEKVDGERRSEESPRRQSIGKAGTVVHNDDLDGEGRRRYDDEPPRNEDIAGSEPVARKGFKRRVRRDRGKGKEDAVVR